MNMMIKSFTALLAVVLQAFGAYCEGEFKLQCGCVLLQLSTSLSFLPSLMHDLISGTESVLGDYVSADCPVDPDEVRDSERPTKLRLPHQHTVDVKTGTTIRESVCDILVGGGGYIVDDLKFTVMQTVEPMEKGFTRINKEFHKISQNIKQREKGKRRTVDDTSISTTTSTKRVIRGIDDPLLNSSVSDSGVTRSKQDHRLTSGYQSAESGREGGDQSYSGYIIRGNRWITRNE